MWPFIQAKQTGVNVLPPNLTSIQRTAGGLRQEQAEQSHRSCWGSNACQGGGARAPEQGWPRICGGKKVIRKDERDAVFKAKSSECISREKNDERLQ